ncbi:MAG: quinoprotein relay system zinc metallohydrolase 2 [Gammaproteobacteria bacterium]
MRNFILLTLITGLFACSSETPPEQPALEMTEIADGIYVHVGAHVPFDEPGADDIANLGFIVGSDCVAVIDTGGSVAIGNDLKQTIAVTTDVPVCYVINTHIHFDHVLGNKPFAETGVEFIGHAKLADAMHGNRAFFIEEFAEQLGPDPEQAIVAPTRGVEDELELDLGGRVLLLQAWPAAHTYTDLTVYDTATATLWAGDLLFMERIPSFDASLRGWLAVMADLRTIPAKQVVPGHGPASSDWPAALDAQATYLTALLEETRAAIQSGQFLDEAQESVATEAALQWTLSEQHHKRNISRAYTELEWE